MAELPADPYGYTDAAPLNPDEEIVTALWLGVAACMLGAVSPCVCYMPWLIAGPMSWYGLYKAIQARNSSQPALATMAMVSNGLAGAMSVLFILLLLFYVLYFVVVLGFVGLAGIAGQH